MLSPIQTFQGRTGVLATLAALFLSALAVGPNDHYFGEPASVNNLVQSASAMGSAPLTVSHQEHAFRPPDFDQNIFWNSFGSTSNAGGESFPSQVPPEIAGTSNAGSEAFTSHIPPPMPIERQSSPLRQDLVLEEPLVRVPALGEMAVPEAELYHLKRTLQNRLLRAHIPYVSLKTKDVLEEVRHLHLSILQEQLQRQVDSKHTVFLGHSLDPRIRYYAIPIFRDSVKETLIERARTALVGWAFMAVDLIGEPRMRWIHYGLLEVKGRKAFAENLAKISNAHKLSDVLKRIG
ncbi:uncharacterized protein UTRI_06224 [Ustilago trichophora]|uniref:Uncharacterized protein n=1 Tax=Ustilago trichophora TaxID=86804 RepID=A0A5C3EGS7_9BASI|nr:uncharacterized protein UTRI_06224 [Ustilago trichophora]